MCFLSVTSTLFHVGTLLRCHAILSIRSKLFHHLLHQVHEQNQGRAFQKKNQGRIIEVIKNIFQRV